jgi:hypothetical protein
VLDNVSDLNVYNNTIRFAAVPANSAIPAIRISAFINDPDGILIANNILTTTGGAPLVDTNSTGDVRFAGNNYWSGGSVFVIRDMWQTHNSLASWRAATGQEQLAGQPVGTSSDPMFKPAPDSGDENIDLLVPFQLRPDSPLVDMGMDPVTSFGIDPGSRDFFLGDIPQGAAPDIGAHEVVMSPPVVLDVRHDPGVPSTVIRYRSEFGVSYAVRRSPDLAGDPLHDWTILPDTPPGDGNVREYTDFPPPGPSYFYVLIRR